MPISDWQPDTSDVGALLRARTKDTFMTELGNFTDATRPTGTEVDILIGQACDDLAMVVGANLPSTVLTQARTVAGMDAACRIEVSFFPEQINNGSSPFNVLKTWYDERLAQLIKSVQAAGGDTIGQEPGVPLEPVASFPWAYYTWPPLASQRRW